MRESKKRTEASPVRSEPRRTGIVRCRQRDSAGAAPCSPPAGWMCQPRPVGGVGYRLPAAIHSVWRGGRHWRRRRLCCWDLLLRLADLCGRNRESGLLALLAPPLPPAVAAERRAAALSAGELSLAVATKHPLHSLHCAFSLPCLQIDEPPQSAI